MICPNCGSHIQDAELRCPACHADLNLTRHLPRLSGQWCQKCGALLPPDAKSCSVCGFPVESNKELPLKQQNQTQTQTEKEFEKEKTHTMARIESALPSEPLTSTAEEPHDHLPRLRVVLFTALAALVLVGGIILYITHPWDSEAFSIKAQTPADTSKAGYPGEVSTLKGQDHSREKISDRVVSGNQTTFALLMEAYKQLKEFEDELQENEKILVDKAFGYSRKEQESAQSDHKRLSVEISNLISSFDEIDTSSGAYVEDIKNLSTLGNYLRNWSDVLSTTWDNFMQYSSPDKHKDEILSHLKRTQNASGKNTYQEHFDQKYDLWHPEAPLENTNDSE